MKDKQMLPLMVLLSDGRANVRSGLAAGDPEVPGQATAGAELTPAAETKAIAELVRERQILSLVIDTELDFIKLGLARPIAEAVGAHYMKLDDLRGDSLAQAVRLQVPAALPPVRPPEGTTA